MPLDRIYLVRHGHRLGWTIDLQTGIYTSSVPSPTGNAGDPPLTSHGVRQSHELAAYLLSPGFRPKPWRVYSSPFYRCLQTLQPVVEALKRVKEDRGDAEGEPGTDFDVRIESGLGEWFGTAPFDHPSPALAPTLRSFFPTILPPRSHKSHVTPPQRGETIAELHDRIASTLAAIIAEVDAEVDATKASQSQSSAQIGSSSSSKAILICSHAAPLIAMGRALTGHMPPDPSEEDFHVFTAGLSMFTRRERTAPSFPVHADRDGTTALNRNHDQEKEGEEKPSPHSIAPTNLPYERLQVPDWTGGNGVGGGWDCVLNGGCSFLTAGAERGWHFNGEESFDTVLITSSVEDLSSKL